MLSVGLPISLPFIICTRLADHTLPFLCKSIDFFFYLLCCSCFLCLSCSVALTPLNTSSLSFGKKQLTQRKRKTRQRTEHEREREKRLHDNRLSVWAYIPSLLAVRRRLNKSVSARKSVHICSEMFKQIIYLLSTGSFYFFPPGVYFAHTPPAGHATIPCQTLSQIFRGFTDDYPLKYVSNCRTFRHKLHK